MTQIKQEGSLLSFAQRISDFTVGNPYRKNNLTESMEKILREKMKADEEARKAEARANPKKRFLGISF